MNILWVDFLANGLRLADPEEIRKLVANAKRAGITHLVVDAKIPYGHVTYPSRIAPHVSSWSKGRFKVWQDRDFVGELSREARAAGLKVLANMDVFAEGTKASQDGMAYIKKEWQVVYYRPSASGSPSSFVLAEDYGQDSLFVNPIHPEVIAYEMAIIREVAAHCDVDGIVLDRCRYPNIYGDFSPLSRKRFEQYIGQQVVNWPEDILNQHGKWFARWTEWRAMNIKNFVKEAKRTVKSVKPECLFSVYVGSWYPLYFHEGVNWASSTYQANLDWTSEHYSQAAYGNELDFIMTGCYYPEVFKQEAKNNGRPADWYSVEGAIEISLEAMDGQVPVVASLYLKDYAGNWEQFAKAVRLCRERTDGVMLFDTVYLESYGWWEALPALLRSQVEI